MFYLFWGLFTLLLLTAASLVIYAIGYRAAKFSNIGIIALMMVSSVLLYYYWGNSAGLTAYYQQQDRQQLVNTFLAKYPEPEEVIALFKKQLAANPNDVKGWFLLGRLYFSQQNFVEAKRAFARAKTLKPQDMTILFQYAQSLYFLAGQRLTPEAKDAVVKILEVTPNNLDAFNLLAADAYHRKDYPTALQYWRKLLALLPPQAAERGMIEKLMKEVGPVYNSTILGINE